MKRAKIGIVAIIGIILISMTVHDMLPYSEKTIVTQTDTLTTQQSFHLQINESESVFLDTYEIQPPSFIVNDSYVVSYISNVSIRVLLTGCTHIYLQTRVAVVRDYRMTEIEIENDSLISYHGIGSEHYYIRLWNNVSDTDCELITTVDYSVDVIFRRPPKTYAWETVRSFFATEGVIFIGVVLITSVLIYASFKMARES